MTLNSAQLENVKLLREAGNNDDFCAWAVGCNVKDLPPKEQPAEQPKKPTRKRVRKLIAKAESEQP